MSATFTSLRPIVQSDGSKLSEKEHSALTGLRVSNGLGTPAHARLTFTVTKESPSIGTKLGAALKIGVDGLRDDADHAVDWELFDGVVVSLGIELATGTTQTVVIEAYDKLYKLGRATVAKTYVNQKPADIITTLARDAGSERRHRQRVRRHQSIGCGVPVRHGVCLHRSLGARRGL